MSLTRLRNMPELSHWPDKKLPYSPERSEVLRYIAADWKLLESVLLEARDKGVIAFDPESKTWKGAGPGKEKPAKAKKPNQPRKPSRPPGTPLKFTQEHFKQVLERHGGIVRNCNERQLAKELGCSEKTVWRRWRLVREERQANEQDTTG